jgi:hypothetical protein
MSDQREQNQTSRTSLVITRSNSRQSLPNAGNEPYNPRRDETSASSGCGSWLGLGFLLIILSVSGFGFAVGWYDELVFLALIGAVVLFALVGLFMRHLR